MSKAHLKTCDLPLVSGESQIADCDETVEKAELLFCWDEMEVGSHMPISTVLICSECVRAYFTHKESRLRYIYGISTRPTEQ